MKLSEIMVMNDEELKEAGERLEEKNRIAFENSKKAQNVTKKIKQKIIDETDQECERKLKNGEATLKILPE